MFKRILSVLTARWFVTLIGAVILALIVWFVGPLIAVGTVRPLDSDIIRLIVVLVILVVWGIWNIVSLLRTKKSNDQLVQGISEAAGADTRTADLEAAKQEEVGVLKERLDDALAMLKRAKLGKGSNRQYLYQLPWYILIGPPGSGKTTALVNSGLTFPLADKFGKDAVRGVGGTRNCDWWFTDEAVLIDTAGRYTTQDSHQAVDAAAWTGFLKLLKTTRPRQPINGALVAISLNDLATMKEAERQSHARTIKQRIKELHDVLGIRFPIYVLFTKVDLAAGFVEFMDDLGKEERQQVWGFTFPLDDGKSPEGPMAGFSEEFELLQERLYQRLLERVHKEPDIDRRSLIFSFPTQMAAVKQVAQEFLEQIFRPTRYEDRPLLRGVYFTSGTQEGTPIDRLMGVMASTFGLDRKRLSAFSGSGRSYFLTRLLREVVFPEAGIVSRNRRVERMRVILGWTSVSLATLVILGMGALWYFSYAGNKKLIADFNAAVGTYQQQIATSGLTLNPVNDARLDLILPPLQTLRTMPAGYDQSRIGAPWSLRFGLYQGNKLGADAEAAYRRALNGLLLPRLIYILENQLNSKIDDGEFVYGRLKIYLMLGVQGPLDRALIEGWMTGVLNEAFPGAAYEATRKQYMAHLAALLEAPLAPVTLDGALVKRAQDTLAKYPMEQRAYALMRQDPDVRSLPLWRVVDHIGPVGARALVRKSGGDLSQGIEGFYTYIGFQQVFVPKLADITHEITKDAWVFGPNAQLGNNNASAAMLAGNVLQLYLKDYVYKWTDLVTDVGVVPITNLSDATRVLNDLAGANSPLKTFYTAVAHETKLTEEPQAGQGANQLQQKAQEVGTQEAQNVLGRTGTVGRILSQLVLQGGGSPADLSALPDAPEKVVEDQFAWLHQLVAGTPAPIDALVQGFGDLYVELNAAKNSLNPDAALLQLVQNPSGPLIRLNDLTAQLPGPSGGGPGPLAAVTADMTAKVKALIGVGSIDAINKLWKAEVVPYCSKLVDNRYPIFAGSSADVTLADFARLFAPGGTIDNFFKTHLAPLVDTSRVPWKAQGGLALSTGALEQLRMAGDIRDALFAGGGTPSARFVITPEELDNAATQVLLELDGQTVAYNHGPVVPLQMQWPGTAAPAARISFQPQSPNSTLQFTGPWALFKLIDQAQVDTIGPDHFKMTFNVGGHTATFDIQAGSVLNPFSLKALHKFRCVGTLG